MNTLTCLMYLCWHIQKRVWHVWFQSSMPVICIPLSAAIRSVHEFCVFARINNTERYSDALWGVHWLHKILHVLQQFRVSNKKHWIKGTLDQFVTTTEEPGIHKPVNGSLSSICRLRFPLFWEYFQWQSLLNNCNASQYRSPRNSLTTKILFLTLSIKYWVI